MGHIGMNSDRLPYPSDEEKQKNRDEASHGQTLVFNEIMALWGHLMRKKPGGNTKYGCLHANCPDCEGKGVKKQGGGACIHMISCPCPLCSPTFG